MAFSFLPLGTTVHVYEEKRIQLLAAGSARISHPSSPHTSLDKARLFAAARSSDIWFSPQPSLEFKVTVRIIGSLHTRPAREELLDDIAEVLGNAKLWSDIRFEVVSQIHDTGYDGDGERLNILLQLQPRSDGSSLTRPTRLPSSLEMLFRCGESVQPPLGILTASIKGVDISLSLLPIPPQLFALGDSMSQLRSSAFDGSPVTKGDFSRSQEPNINGSSEALFLGNSKLRIQKFEESSQQDDDVWESLDDNSPFSSQNSEFSNTSASSCPGLFETVIDHFASISLLDSGFRSLFLSNPTGKHPRIISRAEPGTTALMDVASNVFNPRYHTDVSFRACFIPSISKGIVSLLSNSNSPLVKSKFQALEETYLARHHGWSGQENPPTAPETKDVIKCFLWKTMQRGLHNSGAPCKLTPLSPGNIPMDADDNSLLTSLDSEENISATRLGIMQENPFDFDDELDDEEADILTDYDQYDGEDLMDNTNLDILLSSPSAFAVTDHDIPDSSSHTGLIFNDLNTPPPPSSVIDPILSPEMFPASPELAVHDVAADMDIEIPSSEMEMLDCSSFILDN